MDVSSDAGGFIARWRDGAGGQERANYAMFLVELCDLLGVPRPEQASADHTRNDYVFERRVAPMPGDGRAGGRIDLYKRGCFVLEAKQSRRSNGEKSDDGRVEQLALEGLAGGAATPRGGRVEARWDSLMKAARAQAVEYVHRLPPDHPAPPFVIVADIGRCFEVYADFSGTGRHYELFPDRKGYRIFLDDLADPEVQKLLRTIWTDPASLNPATRAAVVTRGIADRLAKVSRAIEAAEGLDAMEPAARAAQAERIALFLMRLIFSMFAEDVGLLPKDAVRDLLASCTDDPAAIGPLLRDLWTNMAARDGERYSIAIRAKVRYFNGGLFEDTRTFALPREELGELIEAAKADWRQVEPAIFGTLLEQALDPAERARLGAHYTPRAYVERLVNATVIEPLRARWRDVQGAIIIARETGDHDEALAAARGFLAELAALRILDPACGTGNFLYVAMLLLKRLEAEVREAILDLRGGEGFAFEGGETIDPHNFLGLELNPRAAAIAELVLWIGYLQWHFANASGQPAEPILRRFGFVTTNSITQAFSRRVIEARVGGRAPLSLVMAVPDHPWTRATRDAAAVRIAMTVAEAGEGEGLLREVTAEAALDSDAPRVAFAERTGRINADLTVGADVTQARPLKANAGLSSPGVKLHGAGFIVTPAEAAYLGLGRREGLEAHIRPYRNGRDLLGRPRGAMVIDLFGLGEDEVRRRFPEVWQHVYLTVKPERDANRRATYRDNWWIFGEPRRELRPALLGLPRYIATVETARHRVFEFIDSAILPDNKLVVVASSDPFHLGVLSSRIHVEWALRAGGWLGVGNDPVYVKSDVFDPFPFPDASPAQRDAIAALAEELDATRKSVQAEHPDLTLTGLYNVRAKLMAAGAVARGSAAAAGALDLADRDVLDRGRVAILAELHDRLDRAVADAYGWPADLDAEGIVARVVALNAERAAEERAGTVRWLRPDYQRARAGLSVIGGDTGAAPGPELALPAPDARTARPALPRGLVDRSAAIIATLHAAPGPLTADQIAARFKAGPATRRAVDEALTAFARVGLVTRTEGGWRATRAA